MSQLIYLPKQAWASLKHKPGFVATVVTTMGVTLGALLCILTLAYVLIVKPLPYPQQQQLYLVEHGISDNKADGIAATAFTYPGLMHLYQQQTVFSESALIYYGEDVLSSQPSQPTMNVAFTTPEFFSLLGAKMALGRPLEQTEALNTHNPVAVLSYDSWQTEFAGDPDILAKKITYGGNSYHLVGVLANTFIEPQLLSIGRKTQLYMPWDFNFADEVTRQAWGNINSAQVFIGRLTSAQSVAQLNQTLTPLINDIWQEKVVGVDFFKGWSIKMNARTFTSVILGDSEQTVYLLLAGVMGLVLIACANIANLFMSRTAEQQRQLAIHAAVGATKSQLFKALFAESSLLMLLSIMLALLIASGGFYLLQHFLAQRLPRVDELAINGFTLAASATLTLIIALFFARLSSHMINYRALNSTLQSGGKGTGVQVSKKARKLLIISQVAVVTALVFVNINLFKSALTTINQPLGFTSERASSLVLSIAVPTVPPSEETSTVMTEFRRRLMALPQVESVSQSRPTLSSFSLWATTAVATNAHFTPRGKRVDHDYFQLIEQPLLQGDFFSAADSNNEVGVAIVNDLFAKELAADGKVLGMQISMGDDLPLRIIGVVQSIIMPGKLLAEARVYLPSHPASTQMMVKVKPGQTLSRAQVVSELQQVTSKFSIFEYQPLNDRRQQLLFTQYTTAITSAALAVITFFLSGVGLYGILSYSTQMRRFELGTRMAIGAQRHDLIALIIKDNLSALLLGILIAIITLLALYLGFAESLAGYIDQQVVLIFTVTILLIASVSLFACYWPLRQFINQPAIHSLRGSD